VPVVANTRSHNTPNSQKGQHENSECKASCTVVRCFTSRTIVKSKGHFSGARYTDFTSVTTRCSGTGVFISTYKTAVYVYITHVYLTLHVSRATLSYTHVYFQQTAQYLVLMLLQMVYGAARPRMLWLPEDGYGS
jgi:hypothetical protein